MGVDQCDGDKNTRRKPGWRRKLFPAELSAFIRRNKKQDTSSVEKNKGDDDDDEDMPTQLADGMTRTPDDTERSSPPSSPTSAPPPMAGLLNRRRLAPPMGRGRGGRGLGPPALDLQRAVLENEASKVRDPNAPRKNPKTPSGLYEWGWLSRAGSALWDLDSFDPFQMFEVSHESCLVLRVTVARGENVTKGASADFFDTPDPYVILHVAGTPNGKKRTRHVDNCVSPVWEETFNFFLDPDHKNILEVTLMDANYTIDTFIGKEHINLKNVPSNEEKEYTLVFEGASKVHLRLHLTKDTHPDLRYSLALCDQEKKFLRDRRKKVFWGMKKLLGDKAPKQVKQVPIVAILGSGGGFRALTAFSGVMKALADSGILDTVVYTAGLSGSAWYLSTLYSHPDFPTKSPGDIQEEIRECLGKHWMYNLSPTGFYRYGKKLLNKSMNGQPVSFTDFFGCLLGDTLLPGRQESKLSDMHRVIDNGAAPFPLFTCLHVKKNVSARVFQEWIEFNPYDIGIAKYGAFMRPQDFGSKFFLGRLVRGYAESPLHYLQGVWGSAFCILFKRLVQESGRKDIAEMLRDSLSEEERKEAAKADGYQEEEDTLRDLEASIAKGATEELGEDSSCSDDEVDTHSSDDSTPDRVSDEEGDKTDNAKCPTALSFRTAAMAVDKMRKPLVRSRAGNQSNFWKERRRTKRQSKQEKKGGMISSVVESLFSSSMLDTRAGRAGLIFNPLRGLSLSQMYPLSPFSPDTPTNATDEVDFKGHHEPLDPHAKKLFIVDGGLTFNSPYPLLLRPQRGVNLFLSFDYSARPSDDLPPFKELLLAERWAQVNHIPFPPISEQAKQYSKEPVKEAYVFRHPTDPFCPVIIHFAIINNEFRRFKAPGVPRETEEEKAFADFTVFGDKSPYSLFNFHYPAETFDRLAKLMEFNTLLSVDIIKEELIEAVKRKHQAAAKPGVTIAEMAALKQKFAYRFMLGVKKNRNRAGACGGLPEDDEDVFYDAEDDEEEGEVTTL